MASQTRFILLSFVLCFSQIRCQDEQRSYWFSRYGSVNYGRPVSEGTFQGALSRLACSRLCSDMNGCQSFQYSTSSTTKRATCYTFTSYTHAAVMIPSLHTSYYEQRSCMDLFETTAVVIYHDIQEMFLISYSTLRKMKFIKDGDTYRFTVYSIGPASSAFPGFLTHIEGATEIYGNITMLLYGNSVSCFNRNVSVFTQTTCPTDVITSYFTESGFSDVDGITTVDDSFLDLYVFKSNVVHHLNYDEQGAKYLFNVSMPITDPESRWSKAPHGLTAVSYLADGSYFVFESHKWYFYRTIPSKYVTGIFYICDF